MKRGAVRDHLRCLRPPDHTLQGVRPAPSDYHHKNCCTHKILALYSPRRLATISGQHGGLRRTMSFDLGVKMHERDRKRATHLFRTQSLGKNSIELDPNSYLGSFEPDWSKFETVHSTGKSDSDTTTSIMIVGTSTLRKAAYVYS